MYAQVDKRKVKQCQAVGYSKASVKPRKPLEVIQLAKAIAFATTSEDEIITGEEKRVDMMDHGIGGESHAEQKTWGTLEPLIVDKDIKKIKFIVDQKVCQDCVSWFENTLWPAYDGCEIIVEVAGNSVVLKGDKTWWTPEVAEIVDPEKYYSEISVERKLDNFEKYKELDKNDVYSLGNFLAAKEQFYELQNIELNDIYEEGVNRWLTQNIAAKTMNALDLGNKEEVKKEILENLYPLNKALMNHLMILGPDNLTYEQWIDYVYDGIGHFLNECDEFDEQKLYY